MEKQDNPPPPQYHASANPQYMPQGGPSGYPPQGQPPQGHPPQGYPPQGYPPQGVPPQSYPPQGQPAYGYPPQSYPVTVAPVAGTVVIQQGVQMFGERPVTMNCPHCQAQMVTKIDHEVGLLTWLIVGILFIFVLWPCCLIPFCVNDCKDVVHTCSNCNRQVGRKNRLT